MDSPRFAADLERAEREAKLFADAYRGKLAQLADGVDAGETLAAAVSTYELMQDLTGRIMAYASLLYASDTSDPARAKFYGDAHERVTALAGDLLFFELELNRIDDAGLEAATRAFGARALPSVARRHPQGASRTSSRRTRTIVSREVGQRRRRLESAVRRDRRVAASFRFDGEEPDSRAAARQTAGPDGRMREAAAAALAKTLGANCRLFALIMNALIKDKEISDRWRKFADVADSRHLANRVEREVVDALAAAVTNAYPRLSHRYYALKARWFGKPQLEHWDRNAPLPDAPRRVFAWSTARDTVLHAYRGFSPRMADVAGDSSTRAGSTRRRGPARRRAHSPIRRRRRRTPMFW